MVGGLDKSLELFSTRPSDDSTHADLSDILTWKWQPIVVDSN
jgi:hypothetical protein